MMLTMEMMMNLGLAVQYVGQHPHLATEHVTYGQCRWGVNF